MWREPWFWIIVAVVLLLLFGAPKLPAFAKSLGQSMRVFRKEVRTMKDENAGDTGSAAAAKDETSKVTADATTDESKPSS